ncbi:acetate--CoA ligase family protein [Actibacterium sp.]|uniref:acetate--CoA ligase family protein n=1 Tax=Actibacterium sp. TaxID=1872125 RepID=UPI00356B2DEB
MRAGDIALLSQSGALSNYASAEALARGLRMSHVVTFGNAADVTPDEVIDYLAGVPETKVIACYLEGVGDSVAFRAACQKAIQAGKRVIALKSGRSEQGRRAVASHTASMTGSAEAFDALCKSAGVLSVRSIGELLDVAAASRLLPDQAGKLGMISFSGASCALFADYCAAAGLEIATLGDATKEALTKILPWFLKPTMPFDVGQTVFDHALFTTLLEHIAVDPGIGTLVVNLHTINPSALRPDLKIEAIKAVQRQTGKPIVVVWEAARPEDADNLRTLTDCAVFYDMSRAISALGRLSSAPLAAPSSQPRDPIARIDGLDDEHAVKTFLGGLGLPVPQGRLITTDEIKSGADFNGTGRFVLKIVSPDIQHKTEVGGVLLNVPADAVVEAANKMLFRIAATCPEARLRGILVEQMAPAGAQEIVVSLLRDVECGPVLTIGAGGTAIELYRDVARRVCPVSVEEIHQMLRELKSFPLLDGFRGAPPADVDALAGLAENISRIAVAAPWLTQLELNPVLVGRAGEGVMIVDALAELDASTGHQDVTG